VLHPVPVLYPAVHPFVRPSVCVSCAHLYLENGKPYNSQTLAEVTHIRCFIQVNAVFWSCANNGSYHIISGFGIYGAAVVPDSGVGNTWQRLTLVLHEFLYNGLTPPRLHIVISFLTHADHVFLGLPRFLVPGSPNRVMELMHEVARCTCPYHLRRRVRRTAVISSRSSFW